MQGKFIVFEGVEGAGKTTQIHHAKSWLEKTGWAERLTQASNLQEPITIITREPGGTEIGQHIRKLLLDPTISESEEITSEAELLLYAADRAQHVIQFIQPYLEAGHIVFCDRFTDSTVAYQGYGRQLDLDLITKLNDIATFGLKSDLTLWFDVDVEQGLERARGVTLKENAKGDRMEANDLAFHQRVRDGFAAIAQNSPEVVTINANQSLELVSSQVTKVLEACFSRWYPHLSNPS